MTPAELLEKLEARRGLTMGEVAEIGGGKGGIECALPCTLISFDERDALVSALREAWTDAERAHADVASLVSRVAAANAEYDRLLDERDAAREEVRVARQALWAVYGTLGGDQDGDRSPDAVQNLEEVVVGRAREMRAEYDASLEDVERETAKVRVLTQQLAAQTDFLELCGHLTPGWDDERKEQVARSRAALGQGTSQPAPDDRLQLSNDHSMATATNAGTSQPAPLSFCGCAPPHAPHRLDCLLNPARPADVPPVDYGSQSVSSDAELRAALARLAAQYNWKLVGDSGRSVAAHHEQVAAQILAVLAAHTSQPAPPKWRWEMPDGSAPTVADMAGREVRLVRDEPAGVSLPPADKRPAAWLLEDGTVIEAADWDDVGVFVRSGARPLYVALPPADEDTK